MRAPRCIRAQDRSRVAPTNSFWCLALGLTARTTHAQEAAYCRRAALADQGVGVLHGREVVMASTAMLPPLCVSGAGTRIPRKHDTKLTLSAEGEPNRNR